MTATASSVAVAAATATAVVAAALWLVILPRLTEPATEEPKIAYRQLATPRISLIIAVFAGGAAWLAWSRLPIELLPLWTVLSTFGITLAAIDGYTTWIPASLTHWTWAIMAAAGGGTLLLGATWTDLLRSVVAALLAAGLYILLWLITRAGFGFGDVRYVPIVAAPTAALGWSTLISAFVVGSLLALAHGIWRRIRHHPGLQPWAPSLVAGAYISLLFATG